MKPSVGRRIVGAVVCAIGAYFAVIMFQEISHLRKLKSQMATVVGRITSEHERMHGAVDYSYTVEGVEFQSTGVGGSQRDFGAEVTVYYYPPDPSISSLGDPRLEEAPEWPVVVAGAAMAFAGFFMAVGWSDIRLGKRGRSRKEAEPAVRDNAAQRPS